MKVLILHNAYKERGGEDAVAETEYEMLKSAGINVEFKVIRNDVIEGVYSKITTFKRSAFDPRMTSWVFDLVKKEKFDIVHIHNFWPLLTPAAHVGAAKAGAAVVQTLHNFRLLCSGAKFLRNNEICEKCMSGSRLWGVVHRCYRDSAIGSVAVARMQGKSIASPSWMECVSRFIALTNFAKRKFVEGGLDPDRVVVKGNAINLGDEPKSDTRNGLLYVGRLSREKGVDVLINAVNTIPDLDLTIAGDGPERAKLQALAGPQIRFVGSLGNADILSFMEKAIALVMPSICYEGFPVVLLEAYSRGLPVIASQIGSLTELVEDGVVGHRFAPNSINGLAEILKRTVDETPHFLRMGKAARRLCERNFGADTNVRLLTNIYREAMSEKAAITKQSIL